MKVEDVDFEHLIKNLDLIGKRYKLESFYDYFRWCFIGRLTEESGEMIMETMKILSSLGYESEIGSVDAYVDCENRISWNRTP